MKWIEVQISTTTEAVEALSYHLLEMGVGGVVIDDPKDILNQNKDEQEWDYVDEELITRNDVDEVIVKVYLTDLNKYQEQLLQIQEIIEAQKQFFNVGKGNITTAEVFEEDWANAWKKYYKPTKVSGSIVIKPTWEEYIPKQDELIIELDPGMAFGTGTHETTRMCIELLEEYVNQGDDILDIGCGTGILGIAAAKLGARQVVGVDLDPVAVKVAEDNVQLNKVSDKMVLRHGNLLEVVTEPGDVIVANIIADVIIYLASIIKNVLKKEGIFICSGIIKSRQQDVEKALVEHGFELVNTLEMKEWIAIAAKPIQV